MLMTKATNNIFSFICVTAKNFHTYFNSNQFYYASLMTINSTTNVSKCRSYYNCQKQQSFPIEDLHTVNLDSVKHDLISWPNILNEVRVAKSEGKSIPDSLTLAHIEELLQLESFNQRCKYLKFLFKKERRKLADSEKKLKKKEFPDVVSNNTEINNHLEYGMGKNSLLLRLRKSIIHKSYNKKLANSSLFGQKIVIDLGYDEYMLKKEKRDCAAQLRLVHSINRKHFYPYDLYFCNASYDSRCVQYLEAEMPNIEESLISLTEKSYLELFPRDKLIYLSPHAAETLKTYNHDAIYIIGGFVDQVRRDHLSLHKSQKEGIVSYSLPLDQYVLWGSGSKSLSINQVFSIMMTMRDTNNWKEAFQHIPIRKLRKLESDADVMSEKLFLIRN